MYISTKDWKNYIDKMRALNDKAADAIVNYVQKNGFENTDELIGFANSVVQKYGGGSAALAAAMYDATAEASGQFYDPAEPAPLPEYGEVAKTVHGTLKRSRNVNELGGAVSRLVKRAGADTTLLNAYRDRPKYGKKRNTGAQVAWIPFGDTCPFCLMLASNGWRNQTVGGAEHHAKHIHANCDCNYAVRFDNHSGVQGYDPDNYKEMFDNVEGDTWSQKVNSMRRENYEKNKDQINAQKRAAYAERNKTITRSDDVSSNKINPYSLEGVAGKLNTENIRFKTGNLTTKEYVISKDPLRGFKPVDSDKAVPLAREEAKDWINGISETAKKLINKYSYNENDSSPKFYERINSFIRNGYRGEKDYTEQVNIISDALKKSRLKNNYICYRGSDYNPFEGLSIGGKRSVNQFFSTSLKENGAFNGKYKIIVFAPEGTNAGYIESLSDQKFKKQREMLFDKDVIYELLWNQGNKMIVRALP